MTLTRTRRIILVLLLIFAVYSVIVNPNQSAAFVKSAFVAASGAVQSIFQFFDALVRR
jgi:hypothetical protein